MPLGGLISLAVLLPNILYLALPPREVPPGSVQPDARHRTMQFMERLGQIAVVVIPFFYALPALRAASVDALVVMGLALGFYYSAWARYATKGHRFVLLYAPFLGVPLPMGLAPVVYFTAAAVFLSSWPLALAVLVFAVGHLTISARQWKRVKTFGSGEMYAPRRT